MYRNVPILLPSEINGDSADDGLFKIMLISDQVSTKSDFEVKESDVEITIERLEEGGNDRI